MALASLLPYKSTKNFIDNIPNKFIDSISNGVPILSSLEGEVRQITEKYNLGFHYKKSEDLIRYINMILDSKNLVEIQSKNAISIYEKYFDFYKSYDNLLNCIYKVHKGRYEKR